MFSEISRHSNFSFRHCILYSTGNH